MHEDLLGYLLGALDADEQSRIEGELAKNPQLRAGVGTPPAVSRAVGIDARSRGRGTTGRFGASECAT